MNFVQLGAGVFFFQSVCTWGWPCMWQTSQHTFVRLLNTCCSRKLCTLRSRHCCFCNTVHRHCACTGLAPFCASLFFRRLADLLACALQRDAMVRNA